MMKTVFNKKTRKLAMMSDTNLLLTITIVVFVLMYLSAMLFIGRGFLRFQMFFNILNENAALIILSCGMSIVMITGGIDISVGKLTALICMSAAVNLDYQGGNVMTAVLLSLAIGIAFGLVQGYLVAYLDIQPFIVTLAGMFFAKGMTTIVNSTQFNVESEAFVALKNTRVYVPGTGYVNRLGVYVPSYVEIGVIIALLTVALLFVIPVFILLGAVIVQSFLLPTLPAWPFWILALAYPAYLLYRNARARRWVFRAERVLKGFGVEKPMAVLFRSTTPEIRELGKLKSPESLRAYVEGKQELRWQIIRCRFLPNL